MSSKVYTIHDLMMQYQPEEPKEPADLVFRETLSAAEKKRWDVFGRALPTLYDDKPRRFVSPAKDDADGRGQYGDPRPRFYNPWEPPYTHKANSSEHYPPEHRMRHGPAPVNLEGRPSWASSQHAGTTRRTHSPGSSLSSLDSAGPASPYTVNTAGYPYSRDRNQHLDEYLPSFKPLAKNATLQKPERERQARRQKFLALRETQEKGRAVRQANPQKYLTELTTQHEQLLEDMRKLCDELSKQARQAPGIEELLSQVFPCSTPSSPNSSLCGPSSSQNLPHPGSHDIIYQPEFKPISQAQLVTEIKDTYPGLVIAEAKCIGELGSIRNEDHDGPPKLSNAQWQALATALNQSLVSEHQSTFPMDPHLWPHPLAESYVSNITQSWNLEGADDVLDTPLPAPDIESPFPTFGNPHAGISKQSTETWVDEDSWHETALDDISKAADSGSSEDEPLGWFNRGWFTPERYQSLTRSVGTTGLGGSRGRWLSERAKSSLSAPTAFAPTQEPGFTPSATRLVVEVNVPQPKSFPGLSKYFRRFRPILSTVLTLLCVAYAPQVAAVADVLTSTSVNGTASATSTIAAPSGTPSSTAAETSPLHGFFVFWHAKKTRFLHEHLGPIVYYGACGIILTLAFLAIKKLDAGHWKDSHLLTGIMLAVSLSMVFLGMDESGLSSGELISTGVFEAALNIAHLTTHVPRTEYPRSRGLIFIFIPLLSTLLAAILAYAADTKGYYTDPRVFGCVIAPLLTNILSLFWANGIVGTEFAQGLERGELILPPMLRMRALFHLPKTGPASGKEDLGSNTNTTKYRRHRKRHPQPPVLPLHKKHQSAVTEQDPSVASSSRKTL